jgi:neutral ceramidase
LCYTWKFFFVEPVYLYVQGSSLDGGPTPPDLSSQTLSFVTPVIYDTPILGHNFGDCIEQPAKTVEIGETVTAKFVS